MHPACCPGHVGPALCQGDARRKLQSALGPDLQEQMRIVITVKLLLSIMKLIMKVLIMVTIRIMGVIMIRK